MGMISRLCFLCFQIRARSDWCWEIRFTLPFRIKAGSCESPVIHHHLFLSVHAYLGIDDSKSDVFIEWRRPRNCHRIESAGGGALSLVVRLKISDDLA